MLVQERKKMRQIQLTQECEVKIFQVKQKKDYSRSKDQIKKVPPPTTHHYYLCISSISNISNTPPLPHSHLKTEPPGR